MLSRIRPRGATAKRIRSHEVGAINVFRLDNDEPEKRRDARTCLGQKGIY